MITTPLPLNADAYTICSSVFASRKQQEKSVYNAVNRYSPTKAFPLICKDDRMVFFGVSEFVRRYLTKPLTYDDIVESADFMETANSFGGPLPFNKSLLMRVLEEYGGHLPIQIDALPEGSTFFPGEPVMQVTSLGKGFGELAAHIEALLVGMYSIATAKATLCRHWYERIKELGNPIPEWGIHDFGMRASIVGDESEILGLAHLLVFNGTDTFNAAYLSRKFGAQRPIGTSILAHAHRTIQGFPTEYEAFMSLKSATDSVIGGIGSYVADCYNWRVALQTLAKMAKQYPNNTFVARPDSGDAKQNFIDVVTVARQHGLITPDGKAKNLRVIMGDSVNPTSFYEIINVAKTMGVNYFDWGIFGIGGYFRNNCTRDTLSSAYKLSAIGEDNEPVVKLSESVTKRSVPGPNEVRRFRNTKDYTRFPTVDFASNHAENAYTTYYSAKPMEAESFQVKRERTMADFDYFAGIKPIVLSDKIRKVQNDCYAKYRA